MHPKLLIKSLPEGLTRWQVAASLRQPIDRVTYWIHRYGYKATDGRLVRYKFNPPKSRVPWDTLDWKMTNIAIARLHNVSRELVRRKRKQLNKPFVEARGRKVNHACKNKAPAKIHGSVCSCA